MTDTVMEGPRARLAEVVASLSLATDLAGGLPLEHGLRRSLLAVWLGEDLGLSAEELSDVYYVALLGTVGCSVEGTLLAKVSRDELAVLGDSAGVDPASTRDVVAWVLRNFGADEPPMRRLRIVARPYAQARPSSRSCAAMSPCRSARCSTSGQRSARPLPNVTSAGTARAGPSGCRARRSGSRRASSTWRTRPICSTDWEVLTLRSRCCGVDGERFTTLDWLIASAD